MLLGILTLITALSISAVAIYYSVAGLVAIFAAAAVPIIIMGSVLEIGKLVTAVWLHRYWSQATWWLKTYLSTAVLVLMLITSMGIFGFLSKAHIEQTSASEDNIAKIETLQSEIDRNQSIISRAEDRIEQLENVGTGSDANVQAQIDREQERIDSAFTRIQPAIDEQNEIINNVTALFQAELTRIDNELATLQNYINTNDIEKAQAMVGARVDGNYGPKTAAAFTAYQDRKKQERDEWLEKIQNAANSPTVQAAREEIARLRRGAENQVQQSQSLIARLQNNIASEDNSQQIQSDIDEQNERVRTASFEIDRLTDEKITLESEYRKLEAEVGPIKYIAEFVYGEQADKNMLEEAVRWVIIIIIFVFDPLAVLLLIASQYTFEWRSRKDDNGGWLRQYEQARAQRIVDNPGYNIDDPASTQEKEEVDGTVDEPTDSDIQDVDVEHNERDREADDEESLPGRSDVEPNEEQVSNSDQTQEGTSTEQDTGGSATASEEVEVQPDEVQPKETEVKIDPEADEEIHIETEEQRQRKEYIEEQELRDDIKTLKQQWKAEHPNENLKMYKKLYIHGRINSLPWIPEEGYVQNAEQSNDSIWKEIRDK
jgi:peptidoglycan hydrolase-like protein with peptidoglycan-binding domain